MKWLVAALGVGLVLTIAATHTGLFDLDEGFYASVASAMVRTGDYVTPRFMGEPFFEKPPLLYWLMTLFLKMGIAPVLAVRLPSILAAVVTLVMVGSVCAKRGAGMFCVLGLAVTPLFFALGHMAFTDMLLTCLLTASFLLFWGSLDNRTPWLRVPAAACLGLATLAKGPVAGVLFVLIAGLTYAMQPDLRSGFRKYWLEAIVVYLLIAVPWYWIVYKQNGGAFFQEFIVRQNLGRMGGGDTAHAFPFYFYVPVLLVGFFPWSPFLPGLAFRSSGEPFFRYCWTWAWVVFVLFSLSGTKLPSYVLPLLPALAMMLPIVPKDLVESSSPARAWRAPLVATFLLAIAMGFGLYYGAAARGIAPGVAGALRTCAYTLWGGCALGITLGRLVRPEIARPVACTLLGVLFTVPVAFLVLPAHWNVTQADAEVLALAVRDRIRAGTPYRIHRVKPGHPSFEFTIGMPSEPGGLDKEIPYERPTIIITQTDRQGDIEARRRFASITELARCGKYVAFLITKSRSPSPVNEPTRH